MAYFIFGGIGVKLDDLLQRIVNTGNEVVPYGGVVEDSKIYQLDDLEQFTTLTFRPHDNIWLFYCSAVGLATVALQNGGTEQVMSDLEQWYYEMQKALELKIANPLLQLVNIAEIFQNLTLFLSILCPSPKEANLETDENTAIADIILQSADISALIAELEIKSTKFDVVSVYFQAREVESKLFESAKAFELNTQTYKLEIEKLAAQYEELKEKSIRLLEEKIKEINSLKDERGNLEQRNSIQQSRVDKLEAEIHRLTVLNQGLSDDNTNLNSDLMALQLEVKNLTEKLQASGKRSEVVEKQAVRAAAQIDIIKELILTDTNNSDFLKLK